MWVLPEVHLQGSHAWMVVILRLDLLEEELLEGGELLCSRK
jgi:hypothetical protein